MNSNPYEPPSNLEPPARRRNRWRGFEHLVIAGVAVVAAAFGYAGLVQMLGVVIIAGLLFMRAVSRKL